MPPTVSGEFRVAIPGMGDRIFSMTQDDEMVVAFPGKFLAGLLVGLKEAGQKDRGPLPHHLLPELLPQLSAGL